MEGIHTPGPWAVKKEDWDNDIDQLIVFNVRNDPEKQLPICKVFDSMFNLDFEANSKLIAAAPELLASLKECLVAVKELNDEYQEGWDKVIEKATDVIKKAEL